MSDVVLCSCSGGLDSSLTLAILKMCDYNVIACHFNYGHRGSEAEKIAITNVCKELDIELKIFDLSGLYKIIDDHSMLTNNEAQVTTGTSEGLKQLDAWVCGRNMMFITLMASYAESLVMKNDYKEVHLVGGYLNLTESGTYPDNSEYFLMAALNLFKYGTLIGNRIKPLFCLSNLMKSDQFRLIHELNLYNIYRHTISCDRPIVDENGVPRNCCKDGKPACGSGLLSYWAARMTGIKEMDIRNFYNVEDSNFKAYEPDNASIINNKCIHDIIDRILLPTEKLDILRSKLTTQNFK